ncbi:MAG: DUF488 family protein, N3 subclade [Candidatus Thorarchaeota archaeon]|jgi:uncharacterized protein YeaO (DUF488 family)
MLDRCSYWEIKGIKKEKGNKAKFICVARSHPRWWKGKCFESLAPSKQLLGLIKNNGLSWEEYKAMYLGEIIRRDTTDKLLKAIWKSAQLEDVYLVCWEKTLEDTMDTKCHTIILIDMINRLAREQVWYC